MKNSGSCSKRYACAKVVVAFILLVLFGGTNVGPCQSVSANVADHDAPLEAAGVSTCVAIQGQNVTYEGELLVSDNKTFAIEDSEFYLKIGRITLRDSSRLIIRNSQFTAISPLEVQKTIVLEDQAQLIVENATMIAGYFCSIDVENDAVLNISRSAFQEMWEVASYDEAKMHVDNSTITNGDIYPGSGIGTRGTSSLTVEDSDVDGVWIWDNSMVSIKNSVVGLVRAGYMADVHITDSEIRTIEATWGTPTITVEGSAVTYRAEFVLGSSGKFVDSSVAWVDAYDNATVELIDSHAGNIDTDDNATVLLGWHLPLFGLVTMPYTWVPIIQITVAVALIATIITVSVLLLRRRAKRAQREPEHYYQAR